MIYVAIDNFISTYKYHKDVLIEAVALILQTVSSGKVSKLVWKQKLKGFIEQAIKETEPLEKPVQTSFEA